MAGLEDLAKYLIAGQAQDQAIAAEDPYAPYSGIADAIQKSIVSSGDNYSLADKLKAAAITSIFSGISGGLSEDYRSRARNSYQDVLTATLLGQSPTKPSVLSDSLFSSARTQGSLFKLQQALQEQASEREFQNDLRKTAAIESIKNPYMREQIGAAASGLGIKGFPAATTGAASEPVGIDAEAARYQQLLGQYGGDTTRVNQILQQETADKRNKLTDTDSLRRELEGNKKVQEFEVLRGRMGTLARAFSDNSPTSDLDFIYGVAKALDPTSVVRESEAGMVIEASSIDESVLGKLNQYLGGKAALSPERRLELFNLVGRNYDELRDPVVGIQDRYRKSILDRNLNPDEILPYKDLPTSQDFLKRIGSAAPNYADQLRGATAPNSVDDVRKMVIAESEKQGLDPNLALAVAERESSMGQKLVAPDGGLGVMQLMPGTAKDLGVADPMNTAENIRGGVTYLKQLLGQYQGDQTKALQAYNGGMRHVNEGTVSPAAQGYSQAVLERAMKLAGIKIVNGKAYGVR